MLDGFYKTYIYVFEKKNYLQGNQNSSNDKTVITFLQSKV